MAAAPGLAVIMTARNAEAFISEAVESILSQTFSDFVFRVVDHASDDRTREILCDFASKDSRVQILSYSNSQHGSGEARNFAVNGLHVDWLAIADADDISEAHRLATQMAYVESEGTDLVGTSIRTMDESGRITGQVEYPGDNDAIRRELRVRNCIAQPTVVMSKSAFDAVGGYRDGMRTAQDYDLWLRMIEHPLRFGNIREPLYRLRHHSASTTRRDPRASLYAKFNVLCAHAFRTRGRIDPFTSDAQLWESFQYELLAELDPLPHPVVDQIRELLEDSEMDEERFLRARNIALQCVSLASISKEP